MKRSLIFILFLAMVILSHGQTLTVSIPTITATPGQPVYIPVKLTGASSSGVPVSSANIQIAYDTAVLTYEMLTNFYSGTPVNQWIYSAHDTIVSANWLEPSLLALAIPDSTTLYEIKFTYKGGNSPLNFIVYEFTGAPPDYNLVPTTPVNGAVNEIPVFHQVTFRVDMSKENVSVNGVYLAGSFNNWSYSQTPMALIQNGIYEVTLNLQENTSSQYRFVNDSTATGLETVPETCGVLNGNGQYDRQVTVPAQDTTMLPVCFSSCSQCPASRAVTFRVDMQYETVSPDGVHVAGSFNNWNNTLTLMTNTAGTLYEATVILDAGSYLEFRYVNGNTAGQTETVPEACSINGNRYILVPDHDTIMNAYCFGNCVLCSSVVQYSQVTFRVDMSKENVSSNGVYLAGSFNNWSYGQTPMTLAQNGIYEVTLNLQENTSSQYRFVNDSTATGLETVPETCGVLNGNGQYDRQVTVPAQDTTMLPVCFSMCGQCPASRAVTFRVDMQYETVSPDGVHVAGSFNNWNYSQTLMTNTIGTIYEATMVLDEGSYNEFRYVNGNTAGQTETVPEACSINGNRYILIPDHDTIMNAYCFGNCVLCSSVVQYSQVTFRVDMSKEIVAPNGVYLAGSFNNWSYGQTPMTLTQNDIYEVTLNLQENTTVQYRFVNDSTATGLETVPETCGVLNGNGQYDRQETVPAQDTTMLPVCFSMCGQCPASRAVTFRVDMQYETVSPDGVHVAGSFNNWNYSQTLMTNTIGTIYEATMVLDEGSYNEFRYVNGNTAEQAETVPEACSINGNRYFAVPDHDTVLTAYCYANCVVCDSVLQYLHVTFSVDMHTQSISPDGVHIAGTFQGWNPGTTPMVANGDNIYTYTDSVLFNSSVQYKFVNGNTAAGYESVPVACSSNGNRTLPVATNDTILNLVCFSACDSCGPINGSAELHHDDLFLTQNFPNPCTEITHIGYRINNDGLLKLAVFSMTGRLVSILFDGPCKPGVYDLLYQTNNLPQGVYYYQMVFTSGSKAFTQCKKMIVE